MTKCSHWTCIACTLFRGHKCTLNSAPYRPHPEPGKDNQGTDHLGGKNHQRAMKHVGQNLLSPESMTEFFTYIEGPKPEILDQKGAIQALKDYIEECGGDPDLTMVHFAPPPPQMAIMGRRCTIKCVTRAIASPTYGTSWIQGGLAKTQLLCCWDDPLQARVEEANTPTPRIGKLF